MKIDIFLSLGLDESIIPVLEQPDNHPLKMAARRAFLSDLFPLLLVAMQLLLNRAEDFIDHIADRLGGFVGGEGFSRNGQNNRRLIGSIEMVLAFPEGDPGMRNFLPSGFKAVNMLFNDIVPVG